MRRRFGSLFSTESAGANRSQLDSRTSQTNHAGWTLAVVYENQTLDLRNLTLWSGGNVVSPSTGSTTVTDASGTTNLYKGAPLPAGVTVADITAVYGCCSAHNGTYQLRNGTSADYVSGVTPPTPGGLPTVGSKVVIYNNNSKTAMAADGGNGSIKESSAVEIKDGKLLSGNGAAIFEVRQSGQYYRFYNDTYGYLSASGTGTGNKAYYSMTADENADWLVRTCSGNAGGYEMESRTAKFKGYSQWMEYYANGFTVYSGKI